MLKNLNAEHPIPNTRWCQTGNFRLFTLDQKIFKPLFSLYYGEICIQIISIEILNIDVAPRCHKYRPCEFKIFIKDTGEKLNRVIFMLQCRDKIFCKVSVYHQYLHVSVCMLY